MSGSQPYDIQFRPSYVRIKGLYASQLPDNLSGPNDMSVALILEPSLFNLNQGILKRYHRCRPRP